MDKFLLKLIALFICCLIYNNLDVLAQNDMAGMNMSMPATTNVPTAAPTTVAPNTAATTVAPIAALIANATANVTALTSLFFKKKRRFKNTR